MTAADKANQLVQSFKPLSKSHKGWTEGGKIHHESGEAVNTEIAKQCALICVDEIILAIDWHDHETPNKEIQYWNEVKGFINKI